NHEGPLDGPDASRGRRDCRIELTMDMRVSVAALAPREPNPIQKTACHCATLPGISLEIAGDLLELVDYFFLAPGDLTNRGLQAVIDMIVNQHTLRTLEGPNDGVHLLRDLGTAAAALDHRDNVAQVSLSAPHPRHHVLVRAMKLRLAS